jgi:hypothetical protein
VQRFDARHPDAVWTVQPDQARVAASDGAWAVVTVPLAPLAEPTLDGLLRHVARPWQLGIVLARKGGFAVAHVRGASVLASKVGQRHVQGRSKAGGWSQQRFARRRDNQAREAYAAAAEHVVSLLLPVVADLDLLAVGGDAKAVDAVLDDQRLTRLHDVPRQTLAGVPEPRRDVLDAAIRQARSVQVEVFDPTPR